MLLSKKLLNSFFPVLKGVNDDELEYMLNAIGVEVESVTKFDPIENLVVGKIVKIEKHPKSEKLNVCTVLVNNKETIIVTGANNVKENKKVIVALKGATMINGMKIASREILGIESNGMMCGYNELTTRDEYLSDEDKNGIIILDDNAKLNDTDVFKYIGLDDVIYDLSLPSNRNELNGILALGYDLMLIFYPKNKLDFSFDFSKYKKNSMTIGKLDNCDFFGTIELDDVEVKESSWVVKSYLMNSGIKPINWLVDISNLAMIIGGNPTHCYDKNTLGKTIFVENFSKKKNIVALDDNKYELIKNDLVVMSDEKIIGVGGIIGLKDTCVNNSTKKALFEVANFNNVSIKKTSMNMGLKTDASTLFSKQIPLWITIKTFELLIDLLSKSKTKFVGIKFSKFNIQPNKIKFELEKINEILNAKYTIASLKKILLDMKFSIKDNYILPPPYRIDIENINDVAEEILKKINVNKLENTPIDNTGVRIINNYEYDNLMLIKNYFIDKGFSLIKTYNLTSIDFNNKFNLFNSKKHVKVINPISKDREYLRSSLIGQHIDVYEYNANHQNELIPIFEIQNLNYDDKVHTHLCLVNYGNYRVNNINKSFIVNDIFLFKSLLLDMFKIFNYEICFDTDLGELKTLYLKNNSIRVLNSEKKPIGIIGQVNPLLIKNKKIGKEDVYFCEIRLDDFYKKKIDLNLRVSKDNVINKIIRVLSFVVEDNKAIELVEKLNQCKLIKNWKLKDVFKMEENKNSYTIEFEILNENKNKSLSIDEINVLFNAVISHFESNNLIIKKI